MKNEHARCWNPCYKSSIFKTTLFLWLCAVLFVCVSAPVSAQNSNLTVTVSQLNGPPLTFATVCLALNNTSVGSRLTDNQGNAAFTHLQTGDYTMYIFKGGFETKTKQETVGAGSQARLIQLVAGNSTPPPPGIICNAGAATTIPNPKITQFKIEVLSKISVESKTKQAAAVQGDTTINPNVRLSATFDRNPGFFRVGEVHNLNQPEQELSNLPWQPYTPGMVFNFRLNTSEPFGTQYVFMEINAGTSESGASPAKGDGVVLAPAHIKTFTLTGQALQQFIQRATTLGYHFTLTGPTDTGDFPCPNGTSVDTPSVLTVATNTPPDYTETWTEKLFDRNERFLNPFWKMTAIVVSDVFSPPNPSDVTIAGPPSGREDDPFRTVGFKRGFKYPQPFGNFGCVVTSQPQVSPAITSITLQGPDDKQAVDAFFAVPN